MIGLFTLALTVSFSTTVILLKFAEKLNLMDAPDGVRKHQHRSIPAIGGIAIFFTVATVAFTGIKLNNDNLFDYSYILMWALPCFVMFVVGVYDDIINLTPAVKLSGQLIAATVVATSAYFLDIRSDITENKLLNFMVTVAWIIFVTNALNFADNHDGVAVVYSIIVSIVFSIIAFATNQDLILLLVIAHIGALLGFSKFNLPEARAYLGDAGSLLLGTSLGVLSLRIDTSAPSSQISVSLILVLFSFLIADTYLALRSRIIGNRKIYLGGRDHISHRLQNLGFSKKTTLRIISLGVLPSAILSIVLNYLKIDLSYLLIALYLVLFFSIIIRLSNVKIDYE